MNGIFLELTFVLILAGGIALVVSFFKQPSIIAYLIAGLLLGPLGYFQLKEHDALAGLSQIGITLLLFMVGLELDIGQFKRMGKAALTSGLGQLIITTVLAAVIVILFGSKIPAGLFLGIALTFSSTIIVVKLLSEKRDLESLYGKISVSILLIQDFAAILLLILLATFNQEHSTTPIWLTLTLTIVKALVLLLFVIWASKKILPKILHYIGRSDELLLVFSLGWALGLAALVSAPFIGFSLEIGGFLAGIALASSAVHYQIGSRIKSLRDFFIILFFIVLGSEFVIADLRSILVPALVLAAFIVVVKPAIIFGLLARLGYKPRTAFLSSVSLSQISEFSLILAALGLQYGYITQHEVSTLTLAGILSIALSSYSIRSSDKLYEWLRPMLSKFERGNLREQSGPHIAQKNHIILIGAHRLGVHVLRSLQSQDRPYVVVDFNPEVAEHFSQENIPVICGDITDSHIQELVNLADAKLIISTVPDHQDNLLLADVAKRPPIRTRLVVTAHDETEALELYERGVDYVILPHYIGGMHLSKLFKNGYKFAELKKLKDDQIKRLNQHPA
jgi:Kef-type K+ transport system membrane component KefB